jgi:hypothetical protein
VTTPSSPRSPFHRAARRAFVAGLIVTTHVVLPGSLLFALGQPAPAPLWIARTTLAASCTAYLYVCGAWGWLSIGLRSVLPFLVILTVAGTLASGVVGPVASIDFDSAVTMAVATGFAAQTWRGWRGRVPPRGPSLALTFPFQAGNFLVAQGGSSPVVNHHARHQGQRYALDLLALGRHGRRAQGLYPQELERYAIWDKLVVSPCDGVVVAAVSDAPDLSPPDGDAAAPRGNYVAIQTADVTIYLAHLRRDSLLVTVGNRVIAGQPLGLVGNSGNTTEPHLHIHAERGPYAGGSSAGPGVPLLFGGRFLVRNDVVRCD